MTTKEVPYEMKVTPSGEDWEEAKELNIIVKLKFGSKTKIFKGVVKHEN